MNRGGILADLGRRDEELIAFQKALDLHEALAAEFPGVIDYGVSLGGSYCNMGGLLTELDRPAEALVWLAKALATLDGVLAKDPRLALAREFRGNSLATRADALTKLRRFPEALRDYDEALPLTQGPGRDMTRLGRANTLVRSGKPAEAAAEADAVARPKNVTANLLYAAACIHALASAAANGEPPTQERYAARAVELLGSAIDRGFKDAGKVQKDHDLDALRTRPDFQKIVLRIPPEKKP
jgi:tetratricopeptide (TPR) repeat protein